MREEYQTAKNKNKPRIILLKKNLSRDAGLETYIRNIQNDIKYREFCDLAEFEDRLNSGLDVAVVNLALQKSKTTQNVEHLTKRIENFRILRLDNIYSPRSPALPPLFDKPEHVYGVSAEYLKDVEI